MISAEELTSFRAVGLLLLKSILVLADVIFTPPSPPVALTASRFFFAICTSAKMLHISMLPFENKICAQWSLEMAAELVLIVPMLWETYGFVDLVTQHAFEKPLNFELGNNFFNRINATQMLGSKKKCFYDQAAWLEIARASLSPMMVHQAPSLVKSNCLKVRA